MVRWRRPEVERLGLLAALMAGAWAWGTGGWGLLVAAGGYGALSLVLVRPPPRSSRLRLVERVARSLALGAALFAGFWVIYPVMGEGTVAAVTRLLGGGMLLVGLASLSIWPAVSARRGVLPSAVGLLGLGFLDPLVDPLPALGVALGVGFAALVVERARRSGGGATLRGWIPLGVGVVTSLALAYGISRLLPWAQPHVEQAVAQTLSGTQAETGVDFGDRARIGDFPHLGLSRRVVARVWAREPRLLRSRVLRRFDGKTWSLGVSAAISLTPASAPVPEGIARVFEELPGETLVASPGTRLANDTAARVVLAQSTLGGLLVPAGTAALRLAGGGASLSQAGVARVSSLWGGDLYGYALSEGAVRGGEPSDDDLVLPEDRDPRTAELAQRLWAGAGSAQEFLGRVMAHLEEGYVYSLELSPARSREPVAEFLFETRRGYCEHFASAAALLLREGGVAARFVTGVSVRDASALGDHFVARESDAHAWIDVFLPGVGWVEADPTPPAQFAAVHDSLRPGRLAAFLEALRARWSELLARVRSEGLGALLWVVRGMGRHPLVAGALVAGAWAFVWLARRRGWRRKSRRVAAPRLGGEAGTVPRPLLDLVAEVERGWARAGLARPAAMPLLDHLERVAAHSGESERRRAERLLVRAYYEVRFGGSVIDGEGIQALASRLVGTT